LDDLEGHYAPCFKTWASFGAHHENLNEDRLHNQWRRCSPVTLDSDDIRFMRIFAGFPWKGGVVQQWGNRKCVFSRFRTLRIRHLRKWGQRCVSACEWQKNLKPLSWTLSELWFIMGMAYQWSRLIRARPISTRSRITVKSYSGAHWRQRNNNNN